MVSSFRLQQACEGKLQHILAHPCCPCTSKHLSQRHRDTYVQASAWCLLHPEIYPLSPPLVTTWDAEHPLKPLEHIYKIAEKYRQQQFEGNMHWYQPSHNQFVEFHMTPITPEPYCSYWIWSHLILEASGQHLAGHCRVKNRGIAEDGTLYLLCRMSSIL
jgi:hypothetical protein